MVNRREFLATTALSSVPLMFPGTFANSRLENGGRKMPNVCIFSKHLQWLDYEGMAERAKKIGFTGIDLTVRPKGHVLPENVERDLPKAVEAVRKEGLEVPMMSTAILDVKDPTTEKILKTASKLGIKVYRPGWFKYKEGESVEEALENGNKALLEIQELNKLYSIKAGYQNHAGNFVGAAGWDLLKLLKDVDPNYVGVQFDVRHAMVEGYFSWAYVFELLVPYINSLDIKDYKWELQDGKWKLLNVPLGEGMVDFEKYFALLKKYNVSVDFSIHYEYELGHANHGSFKLGIPEDEFEEKVKKDLEFFKTFIS